VKCFIDSLKDYRPLLSKFIRVNVVFCKTEGLACDVAGFLNAGEQNLETAKCVFLPYHKMIIKTLLLRSQFAFSFSCQTTKEFKPIL